MLPENKILITVATFFFPLLLSSQPVLAQVYQWTDEAGKTHFTDNLNAIPEQFLTEKHKRKAQAAIEDSEATTEPEENSDGETQAEKAETAEGEE